jgi:MSHA biogenesis protein MshN
MQKPHPVVEKPTSVATAAEPSATEVKIDKQFRDSPTRSAEAEFQRAAALIERGRIEEATASLRSAVALDPRNEAARQTLAVLLIESRALDEAETVLADGLRLNPAQANFALVLARLRLDRGDPGGALAVLREHGAAAAANPEYRAFVAALLQRLGRHGEAIDEYQAALKLAPQVGVWWVGLGLAQESAERPKDAADAFRQAKAVGNLSPNLADFVDRKLQAAR